MRISDWSSDVCSSDLLGISSFGIYGIGQWQTTFLIRSMELDLQVAGFWSGLSHGTGGIIGVIGVGALTSYLMRRDHRWELWIPAAGYSASAPAFAAAFLATAWQLCVLLLTAGVVVCAACRARVG